MPNLKTNEINIHQHIAKLEAALIHLVTGLVTGGDAHYLLPVSGKTEEIFKLTSSLMQGGSGKAIDSNLVSLNEWERSAIKLGLKTQVVAEGFKERGGLERLINKL